LECGGWRGTGLTPLWQVWGGSQRKRCVPSPLTHRTPNGAQAKAGTGSGAQSASKCRGILSLSLSPTKGERAPFICAHLRPSVVVLNCYGLARPGTHRYLSGVALAAVWYCSGGGLTWVAQDTDIKRLTRLAIRLWARLAAPCRDGALTVSARRVPDVARVICLDC
jgi:hypothetical protein